MDGMDEAGAGDRDEAVVDVMDVGVFAGVFVACSLMLAAAKLGGLPVGWDLVAAPALVPVLVLAVVLLVQLGGDLVRGARAGRLGDLWIDRP